VGLSGAELSVSMSEVQDDGVLLSVMMAREARCQTAPAGGIGARGCCGSAL
jgi:hypothetical protein